MRPKSVPVGVEDWSLDWLRAEKSMREYLEQANAGKWDEARLTAEHIQAMAYRLEDYAKKKKA